MQRSHPKSIREYLQTLDPTQRKNISRIRALIKKHAPYLLEKRATSTWFAGLIEYETPEGYSTYALGPRAHGMTTFHMMPYYALPHLQKRYGPSLKKFLSGKSCIKFKNIDDLPESALRAIIAQGTKRYRTYVLKLLAQRKTQKSRKSKR